MDWSFRAMEPADLPEALVVQERGSVAALSAVFPQDTYPFPSDLVRERWREELANPSIASYVATDAGGRIVGFAARRADEVLHFGTVPETWGSGLATWLHDMLLRTYPDELSRVWLWVFAGNDRARRFYERLGWEASGVESRSSFPPHPLLLEYVLDRVDPRTAG